MDLVWLCSRELTFETLRTREVSGMFYQEFKKYLRTVRSLLICGNVLWLFQDRYNPRYINLGGAHLWAKLAAFFNYGKASQWQITRLRFSDHSLSSFQLAGLHRHLRDLTRLCEIVYPNDHTFLTRTENLPLVDLLRQSAQQLRTVQHIHDDTPMPHQLVG